MRLWNLNPKIMCPKHISGEHNEAPHKFLPMLLKGVKIDGYYKDKPMVALFRIRERHNELAKCMNHKSPLSDGFEEILQKNYSQYYWLDVDTRYNFWDLWLRCPDCRQLMGKYPEISKRYTWEEKDLDLLGQEILSLWWIKQEKKRIQQMNINQWNQYVRETLKTEKYWEPNQLPELMI